MSTVILLIHVMIAVALVGVVLLQRSEGGALGIGGGGGGGGFMTGRSAGNALTKTTAILAACFFVTSLAHRPRFCRPANGASRRFRSQARRLPLPPQRPQFQPHRKPLSRNSSL